MKLFFLFISFFAIYLCLMMYYSSDTSDIEQQDSYEDLQSIFNDESCTNACWLGIEVGVNDRAFVEETLNSYGIKYELNGPYTYNIFFEPSLFKLWEDMEQPVGDIFIYSETVSLMMFRVDLCPSTIIDNFGYPEIYPVEEETGLYFLYPDNGLTFLVSGDTQRAYIAFLYTLDYIDENTPESVRHPWAEFSDRFTENCTDNFNEN